MSISPVSPGQPIDSGLIADIVDSINGLYSANSAKFSNSQVYSSASGSVSSRTADLVFDAGVESATNPNSTTTNEVAKSHNFKSTFRYAPIVVATPVINATTSGKTINVYVRNVTTTGAEIVVKFGSQDTTSVDINIIAIGLASS